MFGFSPEFLFGFAPEWCSESSRNPVRLQPGMVFDFSPEWCSTSARNRVRVAPEYAILPRCALLCRIFEKIPIEDAALLLNADKELVERATATALNELAWNIAIGQDWSPTEATTGALLVQT